MTFTKHLRTDFSHNASRTGSVGLLPLEKSRFCKIIIQKGLEFCYRTLILSTAFPWKDSSEAIVRGFFVKNWSLKRARYLNPQKANIIPNAPFLCPWRFQGDERRCIENKWFKVTVWQNRIDVLRSFTEQCSECDRSSHRRCYIKIGVPENSF